MGLFHKISHRSPLIMQLLIINLGCWFGSFCEIALAQANLFTNAFESLDFPLEAITCLVNILVFSASLMRGRLDLENGAREVLAILTDPKLKNINGIYGLGLITSTEEAIRNDSTEGAGRHTVDTEKEEAAATEKQVSTEATSTEADIAFVEEKGLKAASVIMLSNGTPNSTIKQFMKSNAHVHNVHSILLQFLPLKAAVVTTETCECWACNCIVFWTVEEITIMLARRMPGTLRRLSDSLCLLPSQDCMRNGCHGCNHGLLHVEMEPASELQDILTEGHPKVETTDVVCEILNLEGVVTGRSMCICIPVHPAAYDDWTELLIRSFKSKDEKARGVRVMASEALQEYLDGRERGRRNRGPIVEYNIGAFIGPRFLEILINLTLTFWFTVDGFSSSYVARRTIRNYLVDSKGSGLSASAFLTKAIVKFNADHTQVCQVLTFRGNRLSFITLSFVAGSVNLICFFGWAVLIAFEGGDSAPPVSIYRLAVIIVALGIAFFMDCWYSCSDCLFPKRRDYKVLLVMILEIACIVTVSLVAKTSGMNVLGKWVYGALQVLVWVKWGIGSYILDKHSVKSFRYNLGHWGVLVYSSAFLINAALAGVRSKWTPSWQWKDNYLFSVKNKP